MRRLARHAKDHFIPHEGNGHHPHVLKHRVMLGYSVLLVLLKAVTIAGSIALPSSTLFASAVTPQNIIMLTNATRQSLGLGELMTNQKLTQAAKSKAEDMVVNQYFAHNSPTGVTPWYWIKSLGYAYRYSAENLAVHFEQAEDVQTGWMASASHRTNIVDPRYTETGVGVALGDFEGVPTTFVVQYFAQPKNIEAIAVQPAVEPKPEAEPEAEVVPEPEPQVVIVPTKDQYIVRLTSASTTKASVHVGGKTTTLTKTPETETWSGAVSVPTATVATTGEQMYLTFSNEAGNQETRAIALVAPGSDTQQLFGFRTDTRPDVKLFGIFTLDKLNDVVNRTYIYFILFLATSLLINILVKFHIQKVSVIAHAIVVIVLGMVLHFL
jgi:hypothetical protein